MNNATPISDGDCGTSRTPPVRHQQLRKRAISDSDGGSDDEIDNATYSGGDSDGSTSLRNFIVEEDNDPSTNTTGLPSTRPSSSPPPIKPTSKLFYEPTQFTATQDTNDDDMPDIGDLVCTKLNSTTRTPLDELDTDENSRTAAGPRGKRRKIVEEDSDE